MLRYKPRLLLTLTLPFMASGCQTTTPSLETNADTCGVIDYVYYSRHDTMPTITQLRRNNAALRGLNCPYQPAKKPAASSVTP